MVDEAQQRDMYATRLCLLRSKYDALLTHPTDEPEFRMVLILPLLVFGAGGLYGFGITASDKSYGYILVDVFFGWLCGGMVFGTVATALYIVDALRETTVEAFTCLLLFKNVFAFGICYSGYTWLQQSSVKELFIIVASVEVGICALTIPMCKLRS